MTAPNRSAVLPSQTLELVTYDVYHYLRNPGVRDEIEDGVRSAIRPGVEAVVVGHSLGSVIAYQLLRRDGGAGGPKIPLMLTLGSPLAITAIRDALRPIRHPSCVAAWFNARDTRYIVALYSLEAPHFAVHPAIENKADVRNETPNRHGISGYLSDPEVARRLHEALVSS